MEYTWNVLVIGHFAQIALCEEEVRNMDVLSQFHFSDVIIGMLFGFTQPMFRHSTKSDGELT